MRSGLHILGTDAGADQYKPYIDAAGALVKGITEGIASATKSAPPPPPPPPPPEKSNTVWYVAGGGAVLAVLVALLVRSRG